jgi:hypothetical protein
MIFPPSSTEVSLVAHSFDIFNRNLKLWPSNIVVNRITTVLPPRLVRPITNQWVRCFVSFKMRPHFRTPLGNCSLSSGQSFRSGTNEKTTELLLAVLLLAFLASALSLLSALGLVATGLLALISACGFMTLISACYCVANIDLHYSISPILFPKGCHHFSEIAQATARDLSRVTL